MEEEEDAVDRLLTDWFRRIRESQLNHYASAGYFSRMHVILGVPTFALGAAVGTAVFVSIGNNPTGEYKVTVGLVSMLASVLAALHTFLGYSGRAEKHRLTASNYAAVRRDLELLKSFPPDNIDEIHQALLPIKQSMDHLAESSPSIPGWLFKINTRAMKKRNHHRIFNLRKKD